MDLGDAELLQARDSEAPLASRDQIALAGQVLLELEDEPTEGIDLLLSLAEGTLLEVERTQDVRQRRIPIEETAPGRVWRL